MHEIAVAGGTVNQIWYGMLAPGRMPNELVTRLYNETVKALNSADLRKSFALQDVDPWPGTPAELAGLIRNETARYAKIVEKAGLKKEYYATPRLEALQAK